MLDKTGLEDLVSVQTTFTRALVRVPQVSSTRKSKIVFFQIERDGERNREDWNSANKTLTEFNEYFPSLYILRGKTKSQMFNK